MEYLIFKGLLYLALGVIVVGLHVAGIKTVLHLLGFMTERHLDH